MPFPDIDPIALQIGPFAIRWYALAYIAGLLLGWRYCVSLAKREPRFFDPALFDDLLFYATLGVVLGGRLGYILFYKPLHYLENPSEILFVWQGGMSFHGGFLGVVVAIVIFARRTGTPILAVGDLVSAATPIGLFFGRLANFINGELYGRVTDVSWAVVFPHGGPVPRHPSQLYEAALEGLALFVVLAWVAWGTEARRRPGQLCGLLIGGYGAARFLVEFFREPDAHLGFVLGAFSMGQMLSLPMVIAGVVLVVVARRGARIEGPGIPLPDKNG